MILVGNKKDMESERAVEVEEAEACAKNFDNCKFMEVSAKTNDGVTDLFETIVREIFAKDPNAGQGDAGAAGVLGAGTEAPTASSGKKKKLCTLL